MTVSAEIIPFSKVHHVDYVARQAARMAALPADLSERHLADQLDVQAKNLAKQGVAADRISREISRLEAAIRSRLWAVIMRPGGAA
jgi:hypothetical protein